MAKQTNKKRRSASRSKLVISQVQIDSVCQRLARNQRVRRTLPGKGRLHIDRQLPFLCIYRRPPEFSDVGTERLVKGEASYLVASGQRALHQDLSRLVGQVARTLSGEFGALLLVEVWSAPEGGLANDPAVPSVLPTFTIHAGKTSRITPTVETLENWLNRITILKQGVEVEVKRDNRSYPPTRSPLLTATVARELNCDVIGLAVPPVYRKPNSSEEFPQLARVLRRSLSLALRQCFFEFARSRTTHRPSHYHALGRKAVVKAVWDVDRQLADVSNQFDYLLHLTPVNPQQAWNQFQRSRFREVPEFHYRPLPVDPAVLKRQLYKIPIERVEDPALQRLFQEKQDELDLKITMLRDRETPRFLHESLALFGSVRDDLAHLASDLLRQLVQKREAEARPTVDAAGFAHLAEAEIEFYRKSCPDFQARACVADDVNGLIVSRGKLLINADLSLPASRVPALLAHEVGTHLLTYYNGRQQPFQQLYSGLAGYEELQEGLAVLAEYLVGGLSVNRMRQLAARVVAVRHLTAGASFVETFRVLDKDHSFKQRTAYNITLRVYRGGGLTKDAIYLRGLVAILRYVKKGGDLRTLMVGKLAAKHIPIIKELQYRNVLKSIPLVPRYLQDADALQRLEALRGSQASVLDLVN